MTFKEIPVTAPDAVYAIHMKCIADPDENKVNLGPGAYRTDEGKPYRVPAIQKSLDKVLSDPETTFEYGTMEGVPLLLKKSAELVFGANSAVVREGRVASLQTISGTGANHMGAYFLREFYDFGGREKQIFISDPSWANHELIFSELKYDVQKYPYYDASIIGINMAKTTAYFESIPDGSIVLLHACAHNPTGVDPTRDEWHKLAEVFKRKKLYAFFDFAYHGFATGDFDEDAYAVRYFVQEKIPSLVCVSFSKNAGLYGERVGAVHIVVPPEVNADAVRSQLARLQGTEFFSPPAVFAKAVANTLNDPDLLAEFRKNVYDMSQRVISIRRVFRDLLVKYRTPSPNNQGWDHVASQIGMFSYTGLTPAQCAALVDEHVYLPPTGRIAMCLVNSHNVEYIVKKIDAAVRKVPF